MTLDEATTLRDAAKAAYLKSLEAQSYQVGSGGDGTVSIQRNRSEQLKAEYLDWDRRVQALQAAASSSRPRSRVSYIRPMC